MPFRVPLCVGLVVLTSVHADAQTVPTAGRSPFAPGEQILVLTSGRVVQGQISSRADGYEVHLPAGRMFIPSSQVRFQSASLNDAYLTLRDSLPELTPNIHVELARWCLQNELPEQAQRELLDALRLDPNRTEAKTLLQQLVQPDSVISGQLSQSPADSSRVPDTSSSRNPAEPIPPSETRGLGGFSRPVAAEFVQRIQPLVVSKCSGGGCHGRQGAGDFSLVSLRLGSSPSIAEHNLTAVLKHVDFQDPLRSRLLRVLDGSHGGRSGPLLPGRTGQLQADNLRKWVQAAVRDIAPPTGELSSSDDIQTPDVTSAVLPGSPGRSRSSRLTPAALTASGIPDQQVAALRGEGAVHRQQLSTAESDQRIMEEMAYLNRRDAFDPAVFNQKYHSVQASESNPSLKESQ